VGKQDGTRSLEGLCVCGQIILKCILKNIGRDGVAWNCLFHVRRKVLGDCEDGSLSSVFIK
jgi:hypothetical protein